jgi:hypothetical protein
MRALLPLLFLLVSTVTARADDSRTPRRFWFGTTVGLGLTPQPSDFDPDEESLSPVFAAGLDIGIQRISGGKALVIDTDILPISNIYRARGSIVLGHGFTTKYSLPCAAPAGYTCSEVYNYRKVRSVFGLKLGGEAGITPDGEIHAVEIGLAFRSQISIDMSFMYDPIRGAPGGSMDFTWQIGPFYWGMELRGLASEDQPLPMIATFVMGYTPRMWKPSEL